LPLLFAGQAQKEPFINHALSAIDALLTGVIDDSLASPPGSPPEGARYRVLENASGEWQGHEDKIAMFIGGAWEFVAPHDGLSIFDVSARTSLYFAGSWVSAAEPSAPSGGSVIDSEARAALVALIEALKTTGIFVKPV
jgi:hypothetical protein